MKDLIITFENDDKEVVKKEYSRLFDFTDKIEIGKTGIPMSDCKNVIAIFFEKKLEHFDTIDDLYKHCVSIMK